MLRELILPGIRSKDNKKSKDKKIMSNISNTISLDAQITCNLVDILFRHVLMSIQHDRSSVKLNALTRGMIGGVLGKTRDGTKDYLNGMYSEDIKLLVDDMEKEIMKRKK